MTPTIADVQQAHGRIIEQLHARREADGWWLGELSPSALATATAVSALVMAKCADDGLLVAGGVQWLVADQNNDGGWGDTPESPSNLSTTLLCLAALRLAQEALASIGASPAPTSKQPLVGGTHQITSEGALEEALLAAERYVTQRAGATPAERSRAVCQTYGEDRTFAVPILINLALADLVPWKLIPRLPFELGILPHAVLRLLRAQVVSYALPALIAIGQLLHDRRPTPIWPLRLLRNILRRATLRRLGRLQPATGGFIEAVPLTGFVIMSLAGIGQADDVVVRQGLGFLRRTVRPDGSWPIDSNLSVWVTSQAVVALAAGPGAGEGQQRDDVLRQARGWLVERQHRTMHVFTSASPGGWGWTHLAGGVPDADDTAGALLALAGGTSANSGQGPKDFARSDAVRAGDDGRSAEAHDTWPSDAGKAELLSAASSGVQWLLGLQNNDGGWPTFCRGWGKLQFDRSGSDLTAHALRALQAWKNKLSDADRPGPARRIQAAQSRGLRYLAKHQREDGSWLPLWFGNQMSDGCVNPVIGTSRVLAAYRDLGLLKRPEAARGVAYLLAAQHDNGGWGGAADLPATVEETGLALEALAGLNDPDAMAACDRAAGWMCKMVQLDQIDKPSALGLYFTSLWYWERLYPLIWSAGGLGRYLQARAVLHELNRALT